MKLEIKSTSNPNSIWNEQIHLLYKNSHLNPLTTEIPYPFYVVGAWLNSELIGCSTLLILSSKQILFDSLFVNPKFRRLGIASKLCLERIDLVKKLNCFEVWYNCEESNWANILCHENFNFKPLKVDKNYLGNKSIWFQLILDQEKSHDKVFNSEESQNETTNHDIDFKKNE